MNVVGYEPNPPEWAYHVVALTKSNASLIEVYLPNWDLVWHQSWISRLEWCWKLNHRWPVQVRNDVAAAIENALAFHLGTDDGNSMQTAADRVCSDLDALHFPRSQTRGKSFSCAYNCVQAAKWSLELDSTARGVQHALQAAWGVISDFKRTERTALLVAVSNSLGQHLGWGNVDFESLLVFADWLEERGHPYCEVIRRNREA